MRLAVFTSHPVQYYAPLFQELARRLDLTVFYGHQADGADQAGAGFGVGFSWDIDLLSGYESHFLKNDSKRPGLGRFSGIDTPDIGERLKQGQFDAVMLIGWHMKFLLQALLAAKKLRLPVMVRGDSHLGVPRSRAKKAAKELLYPPFLRLFNAALVVGERNRCYWEHYHFPQSRMFYSPHCVDNGWFADRATDAARSELRGRFGLSASTPAAMFAGKLVEFKQPQHLVEAAAIVRGYGLPLEILVAGSGPLEQSMRDRALALGVPLHMLGFCNQTQMPAAYAASDVVVLPSTGRETWGLIVNEALACRRPVIVSDAVGCAPDMARQLGPGTTYPLGQIDALADRLAANFAGRPSADDLAKASSHFSLDRAARGICEATQRVLSRPTLKTGNGTPSQ